MDALYKKSNWLERNRDKNHQRTPRGTMAQSVLLLLLSAKTCADAYR